MPVRLLLWSTALALSVLLPAVALALPDLHAQTRPLFIPTAYVFDLPAGQIAGAAVPLLRAMPGLPHARQRPVRSGIPTLVLSGEFDPITPPSYADHAAQTLTRRYVYTVRGAGHGVSITPCGLAIMDSFLDAPTRPPDARCLATLPGPAWIPRAAEAESPSRSLTPG